MRSNGVWSIIVSSMLGVALCAASAEVRAEEDEPEVGENAGNASGTPDPSLSAKGRGCVWRVPANLASRPAKKGHRKRAANVARISLSDVPCNAIRMIATRPDGQKAAITVATEGSPVSVETMPGTVAMVYPLSYRMFEADLATGKLAEFGLPKLDFQGEPRPAAAVGYNRRDSLVIVANGMAKDGKGNTLRRFVPSRQGWAAQQAVDYTAAPTDASDIQALCGDNFIIHAYLLNDLNPVCVPESSGH